MKTAENKVVLVVPGDLEGIAGDFGATGGRGGNKGLIGGVWDRVSWMPTCSFANSTALTLRRAEHSMGKENSGDHVVTGSTSS